MTEGAPWPVEIRLKSKEKALEEKGLSRDP
jgi:hypothetical protein